MPAPTPVAVTEESVTPKAARPSIIDHSQYDITEARVGDLSARVFREPIGGGRLSSCEITWRGRYLWSEMTDEPDRSTIEARAALLMRKLAYVTALVTGDDDGLSTAVLSMAEPVAPTWVALPDQPEESAE